MLILTFIAFASTGWCQKWSEIKGDEATSVASSIMTEVKKVKKMDRRFVQTKHSKMVSEPVAMDGRMHYESPDVMNWEYEHPYSFAIEIKGDAVAMKRDGQVQQMGKKQQMGLKSMMKMIVGMSSGTSLFDDRNFDWKLYGNNKSYKVEMVPKNKNVKRMFDKVELIFDKSKKRISGLELQESDGSVTTIKFDD